MAWVGRRAIHFDIIDVDVAKTRDLMGNYPVSPSILDFQQGINKAPRSFLQHLGSLCPSWGAMEDASAGCQPKRLTCVACTEKFVAALVNSEAKYGGFLSHGGTPIAGWFTGGDPI